MAGRLAVGPALRGPLPVREIHGGELQQLIAAVGARVPTDEKFLDQLVPRFASGIVRADGALEADKNTAVSGRKQRRINSPDWEIFLQAIDGKKTVGEIILTHRLPRLRTLRQLRASMQAGLVTAEHV